jgi:hypothetical protein
MVESQNSSALIDPYPNEPDTMSAAIERFGKRGYTESFHARDGMLVCSKCPEPHSPEALVVEDFRRYEGVTNPDDESAVFALKCREHGTRGTYSASYGPSADPQDQDVLQKLTIRLH